MRIINNRFSTPYFIFIKDNSKLSDKELFEKLGLENYELFSGNLERLFNAGGLKKRYLFLTEDGEWKHLMDDWFYTLWHDKELKLKIKELSFDYDIFTCSVGDCDDSFDFVYYQKGNVKREYVVEDPKFNGGELVKNIGEPFRIENIALSKNSPFEKVLTVANSLGIAINHDLKKIRCYGRRVKK